MGTRTAGVDLAAEPKNTAVAVLDWEPGAVRVVAVRTGATDEHIVELTSGAQRIGIDCPFGWPQPFVDFVVAHQAARPLGRSAATVADRRPLAYRATDVYCRDRFGMRPLSVSADRIAHAAFRCAALLPRLDPSADRSGAGRVVEAYPAGSMLRWGGFTTSGYKGSDNAALRTNVERLGEALRNCFTDAARATLSHSDHAFDAVVAAVTAYAQHRKFVEPIPPEYAEAAQVEGWIAVPTCDSLRALLG